VSELRFDPIKNRWVIIAEERKHRPFEFLVPEEPATPAAGAEGCPFEYGFEDRTPPEILNIPRPGGGGSGPYWQVRVVPSRFPALRVEGEVQREGIGLYDRLSGVGAHEVIVENPDHWREMADLSVDELMLVFFAYRERLRDLQRDSRLRYVLIFKNKGKEAGASLSHPHSQLIATPIIPTAVIQELKAAKDLYDRKERCIFCDMILQEQHFGTRIGLQDERFIAIHPYASAFPFETWILPTAHQHDFGLASDDELRALASMVRDSLRRLRVLLKDPPYNMVLHTAPSPHPRRGHTDYWSTIERDFHWHLELVPRITRNAGFEWGSGYTVNPTPPEEAARFFKDADPEGSSPPANANQEEPEG
jgi:UDPglucose--hexose-1-phosphate uridylyltransferase